MDPTMPLLRSWFAAAGPPAELLMGSYCRQDAMPVSLVAADRISPRLSHAPRTVTFAKRGSVEKTQADHSLLSACVFAANCCHLFAPPPFTAPNIYPHADEDRGSSVPIRHFSLARSEGRPESADFCICVCPVLAIICADLGIGHRLEKDSAWDCSRVSL